MQRIIKLQQKITHLYTDENPHRNPNTVWLFPNHVLVVAEIAVKLARKYHANEEHAHAAALLHDSADVEMERNNPQHETRSLELARQLLEESGFDEDEIHLIVDDAIKFHSCYPNGSPQSDIGKILATADALAHFQTDFYPFITGILSKNMTKKELADWVLQKIDRDLQKKIFFEDEKQEILPNYKKMKQTYST